MWNTLLVAASLVAGDPVDLQAADLALPAGDSGLWPDLVSLGGERVALSWIRSDGESTSLSCSILDADGWSEPAAIAAGSDWFVNWADTPILGASRDGTLSATWLQRNGESTYAYGVRHARSSDADSGEAWSSPEWLHTDRSASEHGFVSLAPLPTSGYAAVWLDGRNTLEGGAMALYTRTLAADGALGAERALDERVCDCCQTAAVALDDGRLVVAYRDRSREEVRDIAVVRGVPGRPESWSAPKVVHADRWTTPGCPVNGPALASHGEHVALVWFTMGAFESPAVQFALSTDGGATFGMPRRVDDGDPHGNVDVVWSEALGLCVSWLERVEDGYEWRVRALGSELDAGDSVTLGRVDQPRRTGFLRMAAAGSSIVAAWTDPERGVRVARVRSR